MKSSLFTSHFVGFVGGVLAVGTTFFMFPRIPFLLLLLGWMIFGGIWIGRFLPRKNITGVILGLNLLAFSGILFAVEGALGFFQQDRFQDVWDQSLGEVDSELGLIPRAGISVRHQRAVLDSEYHKDWDVTYNIDQDHSRMVPARPSQGERIALFGGSFMFGEGLPDEKVLANVLQQKIPQYRFYNYGMRGHGTGQNYLYVKRVLREHPDTRLCIVGFIFDHIRRTAVPKKLVAQDWGRNHPILEFRRGEVLQHGLAYDTLHWYEKVHVQMLARSLLYWRLFSFWEPTQQDWDLVENLILEIHEVCQKNKSAFMFVLLPSGVEKPHRLFASPQLASWKGNLIDNGVWVVDLVERFNEHFNKSTIARDKFFFKDSHPNPLYVELISSWITEEIGRRGTVGNASYGTVRPIRKGR